MREDVSPRRLSVRDRILIGVGISTVVGVGWLLLDTRASTRPTDAGLQRREAAAADSVIVRGDPQARTVVAAQPRSCTVRFVDARGTPLPQVEVVEARTGDRFTRRAAEWRSDVTGVIHVDPPETGVRYLVACREGHAAAEVLVAANRPEQEVVLEDTPTQLFRFRDGAGQAVEGLVILASANPVAEDAGSACEGGPWYPGGHRGFAIFRAITDGYGEARMPWLPRQDYGLKVVDPHWVLHFRHRVKKTPLPADPIDLVVVQPHVGVVRFEGVPVDTTTARMINPEQADWAHFLPEPRLLEQRLAAEYPGHCIYVGFRRDGAPEPIDLRGEALSERGNLLEFRAKGVLVADFKGPLTVTLADAEAVGGTIRIELDPSLEPFVDRLDLRSFWRASEGGRRLFPLRADRPNPVPAGAHIVRSGEGSFSRLLPEHQVDVTEGNEVVVRFVPLQAFRSVIVRARVPEGRKLPGAQVLATHMVDGKRLTQAGYTGVWREPLEMFLPPGTYALRTWTESYETLWTDLQLDRAEGPPIEVVLELKPKVKKQ